MSSNNNLDDLMDSLVAEYSDLVGNGRKPDREEYLEQVPEEHREALDRCLRMIDVGGARAPTGPPILQPGAELGGYRIERVLGRGGMAIVYVAEDLQLGRRVALKVLRPGLALERRHVDRFRREATAIARIQHPHILQVYTVGEENGYHYIATEYVGGPNLAEVLERLPRDREWTAADLAVAASAPALARGRESYEQAFVGLLSRVVRAVAVAHELGIIHRDIKPSNILIHPDGRPVVADFGLAKDDADLALSLTGEVLGTPHYMSPEQVAQQSGKVDVRTDIYSLGVTLYEGLTGRRPFEGETIYAIFDAIQSTVPPSVRSLEPRASRDADAITRRAMEKDPEERYASAMDLAVDLERLARGEPSQALLAEGGVVRRFFSALGRARGPAGFEYRSARKFLGLPLVHINLGPPKRGQRRRVAKGWLAIGEVAQGGFALGAVAVGGIAIGGCGIGLLGIGGFALGGIAVGGAAVGMLLGIGGGATGLVAIGGGAYGYYAIGGGVDGAHTISAVGQDPEAVRFFSEYFPWLIDYIDSLRGQ